MEIVVVSMDDVLRIDYFVDVEAFLATKSALA